MASSELLLSGGKIFGLGHCHSRVYDGTPGIRIKRVMTATGGVGSVNKRASKMGRLLGTVMVDERSNDLQLQGPVRASSSSLPDGGEFLNADGRNGERGAECSRRETVAASLACLLFSISYEPEALAGGFDKYMKKKKLDPLDTYVPTVLLAQSQFQEVDSKLGGEQKTYADARSLLRTGPAASLRTDIRAVAQYASETGNDDGVSAVDQCLRALEDLDSLLLQASRSEGAPVERMRKDVTATVAALDRLLATVPAPILEKAKAIADAYRDY